MVITTPSLPDNSESFSDATGPAPGSFGADETPCWEVRDTFPGGHVLKTSCLSRTCLRNKLQEEWEENKLLPICSLPLSPSPLS